MPRCTRGTACAARPGRTLPAWSRSWARSSLSSVTRPAPSPTMKCASPTSPPAAAGSTRSTTPAPRRRRSSTRRWANASPSCCRKNATPTATAAASPWTPTSSACSSSWRRATSSKSSLATKRPPTRTPWTTSSAIRARAPTRWPSPPLRATLAPCSRRAARPSSGCDSPRAGSSRTSTSWASSRSTRTASAWASSSRRWAPARRPSCTRVRTTSCLTSSVRATASTSCSSRSSSSPSSGCARSFSPP
mmetsp:Transcript_14280/g.45774  ORF Transcript_14280/g.45774 Transcript_14280/m.45774 type:complete len:248 (+) Transcript_14280:378-1121(+)